MNICLVSQEYPPETARGGIGTQAWNKARPLAHLGHQIQVISCAVGATSTSVADGVTVHRIEPPGWEFPVYNHEIYWLGYTWAVLRKIHQLLETTTFDVIDFAEYGAEGFAYQLARVPYNSIPVVVQLHSPIAMFTSYFGWPEESSDFYQVGSYMEGVSIRLADTVMSCSSATADFTAEFYGIPR